MLLLSKEDIEKAFSMADAIAAVKKAFVLETEKQCETPLRTNIRAEEHNGNFLFMPAYAQYINAAALKIINLFPDNKNTGLPTSDAQVLLMDGTTGAITALLDGTCVTQLRTGAASGAAFDVLAKEKCAVGALIGTGGLGAAQLEAMLTARKLNEVRVFSRNYDRTKAFAARMQEKLAAYGAEIIAVHTSQDAVKDADLIITATPSDTPVFDARRIKAGATISCIGSYQYHMQELDPRIFARAPKLYLDSRDAVLAESGDILRPLEQGIITEESITGELGAAINGTLAGRENDEEIIVFKSVGVAAQDLVTAKEIYDNAVQRKIGKKWPQTGEQ